MRLIDLAAAFLNRRTYSKTTYTSTVREMTPEEVADFDAVFVKMNEAFEAMNKVFDKRR